MTYVNCPACGGKLLEGENGSNVRLKCSKCGKIVNVKIENEKVTLSAIDPPKNEIKKIC